MKLSSQRKRKALGVSIKGNEVTGSPEKNCASAKRNYKRQEKPAEEGESCPPENDKSEKSSITRQPAGEKFLNRGQSSTETAAIRDLKLQDRDTSTPSKIKLQLFPVNSSTRLKVEKDGHNPFLELTLSLRKKISSIIKHLNTKWGSSNAIQGELMLFPYDVKLERIESCSRWTSNCSGVTSGEVHMALGSPAIFRLRYGWVSNLPRESSGISVTSMAVEGQSESNKMGTKSDCNVFASMTCDEVDNINDASQVMRNLSKIDETEDVDITDPMLLPIPGNDVNAHSVLPWDDSLTSLSIGGLLSEASLLNNIKNSVQESESRSNLQPIELVSEISVGALLSEASLLDKINNPKDRSGNKSSFLINQSVSEMGTGRMLCNSTFQSKSDNLDLKTQNEAGCQRIHLDSELCLGGLISEASRNTIAPDITSTKKTLRVKSIEEKGASQEIFPWNDDGSISLSIGGLLSEASFLGRFDGCDSKSKQSTSRLISGLPSLGSSEASAPAQHNLHIPVPKQPLPDSFSSILDAEETCHAFAFKKVSSLSKVSMTSKGDVKYGGCCDDPKSKPSGSPCKIEVNGLALV